MTLRTWQQDALTILSDGAAPYTADGTAQVGGSGKILDMGGGPSGTSLAGQISNLSDNVAAVVVDVSAIDTTSSDETYLIALMGSNNSDGTKPVVLGSIFLGYGGALPNGSAAGTAVSGAGSTTTPGRFVILFLSEQNSLKYRYLYLRNDVSGTTPSISYKAFLSTLPMR